MRKSDVKIVEETLYSFPDICLDLQRRKYVMEAGGSPPEAGRGGGGFIPEQIVICERKESSPGYMLLAAAAERICDAYNSAPRRLREAIRLLFFLREDANIAAAQLSYSRSQLFRCRSEAVLHMSPVCLQLYPVVKNWRETHDAETMSAIRLTGSGNVDNHATPVRGV
jgi:hypothetical protein